MEEILADIKENQEAFGEIAQEESQDLETAEQGGRIFFDSLDETIPNEVKNVAFSMRNGELSEPIMVHDYVTGSVSYYIIQMVKNEEKGNDYEKYVEQLTEVVEQQLLGDEQFVLSRIKIELSEADVQIKEEQLLDLLTIYSEQDETSASSNHGG